MTITDFHVHAFPNPFESLLAGPLAQVSGYIPTNQITKVRRRMRDWMRPYSNSLHQAQTVMRWVPESARRRLDAFGSYTPIAGLLLESTLADLKDAMERANVGRAVLIAAPPTVSNEFVLAAAQANPNLVAAVNIPPGTARPGELLKDYVTQGARILKIHPAADGEGVDSSRYRALMRSAADLGLPVILHTGCMHSNLLYKDPLQGQAQRFSPWYREYTSLRFVLAHMNFHEPHIALDLCEEFPNLWVDTSWQPAETVGEAVRRLGPSRILFGSDWPIVGNNIAIGLARIDDAVNSAMISAADRDAILSGNAETLLK